jgi:succinate dehydrogenase / fumarate reductase flavoprotein subunit
MTEKVGVVRTNADLDSALDTLRELEDRSWRVGLGEASPWANATLPYARQVQDMISLGRVIAKGARLRDECRGSHFKPEFDLPIPEGKFPGDPEFEAYRQKWKENNEIWMKSTVATHTSEGPSIRFEPVDASVMAPEQPRDYR